jgi:uncharacterized phage protein (TIGR01671 family)
MVTILKREIRFRAWDKANKVIYYPEDISHITFGHIDWDMVYTKTGMPGSWGKKYPDEVDLMQFTGLHDKNGKEIYEGDIVQRGVIIFERGKFQGCYFDSNGNLEETWEDDLYQERNIEVLGNIYENPELLKS